LRYNISFSLINFGKNPPLAITYSPLPKIMQCPNCGSQVESRDRFCEECGASLIKSISNKPGCNKCGAPAEEIDNEGFCSVCGFHNKIGETDHIEINIDVKLGAVSDVGVKRRENQDFFACAKVEEKNTAILVVCDGISSSQTPELAAKAAAEITCQSLVNSVKNNVELNQAIPDAIAASLESICQIPYTSEEENAPATTIVAAIVQDQMAKIFWLGDSRAYWISREDSQILTVDHSWVNEMVASGKMTAEDALQSEYAHAITRWLGADMGDEIQLSFVDFKIPGSGYLLLCSDGLWNYAPDAQTIAHLVYETTSDEDAVTLSRRLVEWARSQGGHDNITVAILSLLDS
jgi:PPM family protein phosphatase